LLIGVDGCRVGWVAAFARIGGAGLRTELRLIRRQDGGFASLVRECEAMPERPVVAVDVPIGLPATAGLRDCDRRARELLGRRWMCVFPAPDRGLFGLTFEQARDVVLARRAEPGEHPVMTHQTMAILPKIEEVDAAMAADPSRQRWIAEVHPELCFAAMAANGGLPSKRHAAGRRARLALLRRAFPDVVERARQARWPRREVAPDDILDAYAALWTARRYADGSATCLGGDRDEHGLLRRMIA
jgi:predicted RNase H-like nuclease